MPTTFSPGCLAFHSFTVGKETSSMISRYRSIRSSNVILVQPLRENSGSPSSVFPDRGPFFHEGPQPFGRVLRFHHFVHVDPFGPSDRLHARDPDSRVHRPFRHFQNHAAPGRQSRHELLHVRVSSAPLRSFHCFTAH